MIPQSGEEKTTKKRPEASTDTGFEWSLWNEAVEEAQIDLAEFYHPEEFRKRRKMSSPEE